MKKVAFLSFVAALGGILFGYDTAVISGTISAVADKFGLDAMADLGIEMDIICLYGDDRITEMLEDGRVYASIMSPSDSIALKAREQIITYLFSNTLPTSECFYVRGEVRLTDAPRTSEEENAEENGEEDEDAEEGTADGDTGEPDEGEIDSGDTDESEQRSGDSA